MQSPSVFATVHVHQARALAPGRGNGRASWPQAASDAAAAQASGDQRRMSGVSSSGSMPVESVAPDCRGSVAGTKLERTGDEYHPAALGWGKLPGADPREQAHGERGGLGVVAQCLRRGDATVRADL